MQINYFYISHRVCILKYTITIFILIISKSTTYINWPARFTFTYLEPETTYYVTVTDLAGNTSGPAAVRTSAEPESVKNEVLAEYFDRAFEEAIMDCFREKEHVVKNNIKAFYIGKANARRIRN